MPLLVTDLHHAVRGLRKSPLFAAVAIASLALGIGANVTIYSVVREMILDDISARQPEQLARIAGEVSYDRYRQLRDSGVFHDLAYDTGIADVTWRATGPYGEVAWRIVTSANFFDVLGIVASSGRLYSQADEERPVAVVSYGFWRGRLNGDPRAVGHALELNGKLYTIVGVLPRDYRSIMGHGVSPEVYLVGHPSSGGCHPFGRLRDGVTRTRTQQALTAAAGAIGGRDFARQVSDLRPMAGLAANAARGGDDRRFFVFFALLFGTAAALGVIASFNVAGMLLARGVTRQREMAIRTALGASRFQVGWQLLSEGLVLAGLGAFGGLAADAMVRNWLRDFRWPSAYNLPFEFHFQGDRGLFLYGLATALGALLVSSLVPSVSSSRADLGLAMKQGEPAFSLRRWNLRNTFLTVEVALTTVLLVLGAVFSRSFLRVATLDPGYDVPHTAMVTVWPPEQLPGELGWRWRDGVVGRLKQVPGVVGVTSIAPLPLMGELSEEAIRRSGVPVSLARDAYEVGAGEEFCKVLGMPILRGRDFEIADRTRQPIPVLVNQTLARQWFGEEDPVGAQLLAGREKPRTLQVIGVTADAKMRTLGEGPAPVFFTPYAEAQLLVRVAGSSAGWMMPLRNAMAELDKAAAIDVRPLSDAAAGAIFPMRIAAGFVGSLSALALLLAVAGLYSAVSYATRRRTREMAIRAAIGATRSAILAAAIRDGLSVLALGIAAGLPLALAAIRPISDILPSGVDPWSVAMIAAAGTLLLATGAVAAWIPARHAAGVEPSQALREE